MHTLECFGIFENQDFIGIPKKVKLSLSCGWQKDVIEFSAR